jgi:predicted hotdog family 3-hydroxylacyl-ACP dehydratase
MCLLDAVLAWDGGSISCITETHRDVSNPLRRDGRLAALHTFEYGAQAAAIHGGLLARSAGRIARSALLAALRDARLYVQRLDDIAAPLTVMAQCLTGGEDGCIYRIDVSANGELLARARVIIIPRADLVP